MTTPLKCPACGETRSFRIECSVVKRFCFEDGKRVTESVVSDIEVPPAAWTVCDNEDCEFGAPIEHFERAYSASGLSGLAQEILSDFGGDANRAIAWCLRYLTAAEGEDASRHEAAIEELVQYRDRNA